MRYAHNPILSPEDLCPSQPSMQIECLLNPGVFRYDGKVWMLVRVAERPAQAEGEISFPVLDAQNRVTVMRVPAASPELDLSDPRVINYKGEDFLTTMSHLRLVSSTDGIRFREEAGYPPLTRSVRDRRLPRHADRQAVLPDLYGCLGQWRGGADAQHVGLAPFHRLRAGAAAAQ